MNLFNNEKMSIEERKSRVRVSVTKWASAYVFGGSATLIAALWIQGLDDAKLQFAKDVYMTVLPVATGVITYWFASRSNSRSRNEKERKNGDSESNNVDENINQGEKTVPSSESSEKG